MPLVSKTVEVAASAESIMAIVADFESYPLWNDEIKGCWVLARYEDGRPSQLRLDVVVQGQAGTFITAVYYPGENQIYTVLQQGDHFEKQEQKFSVVPIGATSLLTVDLDVETKLPFPKPMVKKAIADTLDYLADNLKARAEQLAASRSFTPDVHVLRAAGAITMLDERVCGSSDKRVSQRQADWRQSSGRPSSQVHSPISSSRSTNRCAASVNSPLVSRTTVSTSRRRNAAMSSRCVATAAAPHAASLA